MTIGEACGYEVENTEGDVEGSMRERERGFTFFEILVVVTIIGLLAALVGPRLWKKISGGKQVAAKAQIELFGTALDAFRLDTGRYPTTEEGLKALREKPSGSR